MIVDELRFIAPELSLLAFAILVILLDLFVKQKKLLAGVSIVGLIVAVGFTLSMWGAPTIDVFNMIAIDGFALFFKLCEQLNPVFFHDPLLYMHRLPGKRQCGY